MAPTKPNSNILAVTIEELSEEDQALINKACDQLKEKCLMLFGRTRDKVIQKIDFLRVLMSREMDEGKQADKKSLVDALHKLVHDAMANHKLFLFTFSNNMMDIIAGFLVH